MTATADSTCCPSWEEFSDFKSFLQKMKPQLQKHGFLKIKPPRQWPHASRSLDISALETTIEPVYQVAMEKEGNPGAFIQLNVYAPKTMSIASFHKLANDRLHSPPPNLQNVEQEFWQNICHGAGFYGADVPGSLFDDSLEHWNLASLPSILSLQSSPPIPGIHSPCVSFGTYGSRFPFHTEDMDLLAISYLHFGAPKRWYFVPPSRGKDLESLAQSIFGRSAEQCRSFLRHKTMLLSPQLLQQHNIQFAAVDQEEGTFIVQAPYAYHMGFNLGFNIAEAVNFATADWVPYGMAASQCSCLNIAFGLPMDIYVREFESPETYADWSQRSRAFVHPQNNAITTQIVHKPVKRIQQQQQQQGQQGPKLIDCSSTNPDPAVTFRQNIPEIDFDALVNDPRKPANVRQAIAASLALPNAVEEADQDVPFGINKVSYYRAISNWIVMSSSSSQSYLIVVAQEAQITPPYTIYVSGNALRCVSLRHMGKDGKDCSWMNQTFIPQRLQEHLKGVHELEVKVKPLQNRHLSKLRGLKHVSSSRCCNRCGQRVCAKRKNDKRDQAMNIHGSKCEDRLALGRGLKSLFQQLSKRAQELLIDEITVHFDFDKFKEIHAF